MSNIKDKIVGFDVLKFILAFFVVAIHCGLSDYNYSAFKITELAVPSFFIMSGYLLQYNLENKYSANRGGYFDVYLKHLLKLYVIWSIIYLPFTIYGCFINDNPMVKDIFFVLRGWLFVGENYMSWPLWYLLALIVATWLIKQLVIKRKYDVTQLFTLAVTIAIIGQFVDVIQHFKSELEFPFIHIERIYRALFGNTRNGIFQGLIYVTIGMVLYYYRAQVSKINSVILILSIVFFGCAYYMGIPFAIHLVAASIILLVLRNGITFGTMDSNLRSLSTLIYFTHMLFVGIMQISNLGLGFVPLFLLGSVSSLLFSISILFVSYRYKIVRKIV